jgi:hypothetical protein
VAREKGTDRALINEKAQILEEIAQLQVIKHFLRPFGLVFRSIESVAVRSVTAAYRRESPPEGDDTDTFTEFPLINGFPRRVEGRIASRSALHRRVANACDRRLFIERLPWSPALLEPGAPRPPRSGARSLLARLPRGGRTFRDARRRGENPPGFRAGDRRRVALFPAVDCRNADVGRLDSACALGCY